ncbi:MAG: hypothetical protein JJE29_03875 [Peptostreptococcaceae bacterium]|nr:hypothetical protein [Peptostreptococcaceae bacterium]
MNNEKHIKVGIGFATGRKTFQRVLRTNIYNWLESGLVDSNKISLNLFVAYDLDYQNTKSTDYSRIHLELAEKIDGKHFIGRTAILNEIDYLIKEGVVEEKPLHLLFGKGYAAKRNAALYFAIKNQIDYLIFLDDDEYPMAVTNSQSTTIWSGQHILLNHLQYIEQSDITYGHHCGYVSPIPYVDFDDTLTENEFRSFIEAISNDIVNWDTLKSVMANGGVTYADKEILISKKAVEVQEINHAKFISGSNLCINLTKPSNIFPFYNPPKARGEDTFLSTCLSERTVQRVPCYTFHDGFSTYNHLLAGVLPVKLKFIKADNAKVITRFYKACIGWIRYKPLLLYITDPEHYEETIDHMRSQLIEVLPNICAYFDEPKFMTILKELDKYNKNVHKHYEEFEQIKDSWMKIMNHFEEINHNRQ